MSAKVIFFVIFHIYIRGVKQKDQKRGHRMVHRTAKKFLALRNKRQSTDQNEVKRKEGQVMPIDPEKLFSKDNEDEDRDILTKRSPRIDRSGGEMSESDVRAMASNDREGLRELFQTYLYGIASKDFDDTNKFQFSRTKLMSLMNELDFEAVGSGRKKTVIDRRGKSGADSFESRERETEETEEQIIRIERGHRKDTKERKFAFPSDLTDELDELLEDLSNQEKSKVIEQILTPQVHKLLMLKREGKFHVEYVPEEAKRLI